MFMHDEVCYGSLMEWVHISERGLEFNSIVTLYYNDTIAHPTPWPKCVYLWI